MCVSFTGDNLHQGGDLICSVRAVNPGVQGDTQNLVALTDVCRMEDGQSAGCPDEMRSCLRVSQPTLPGPELTAWGAVKKLKTPRQRAAYLVGPLCCEIPRKAMKEDKHVQPHV